MPSGSPLPRGSLLTCAAVAALVIMLVPAAAWANSCLPGTICFSNSGGTMTGSPTTGFQLNGNLGSVASTLTDINGNPASGTLSFTLGSLMAGNMATMKAGQSVYFNPGTLTITGTFQNFSGTLFTGTFGLPGVGVQWTLESIVGKVYYYALTGPIFGTWFTGLPVNGATNQFLFKSTTGPYTGGSINLESGNTFVVVPEPATISLMGTGLLGLGMMARRRAKRRGGGSEAT